MNKLEKYLKKVGTNKMCPVAFIFRDDNLLIGLRNYTPDKWKKISVWTGPGGRCDDGETLEITLRRETAEEVGITDLKITDYLGEVPGAKEGDTKNRGLWNLRNLAGGSGALYLKSLRTS